MPTERQLRATRIRAALCPDSVPSIDLDEYTENILRALDQAGTPWSTWIVPEPEAVAA